MNPAEDGSFCVDCPLSVHLDDSQIPAAFHVVKSLTPFTKAQIYLVFDPRFLDERHGRFSYSPSHLWTLDAESKAAKWRAQVAAGEVDDDFDEDMLDNGSDDDDDEVEPWLWEEYYFRIYIECFKSEVGAYERLVVLQGRSIPKFYGSGKLLPIPSDLRAIEPRLVLMEYIPGLTLHDIDPRLVRPDLYEPLLEAVAAFGGYGIFHNDIRQENIMFTPAEAPERAVLIDFGFAGLQTDDYSGEAWDFNLKFADDVGGVKAMVGRKLGINLNPHNFESE
ncbi:hypothetical protein AX15_005129 [Amanita polypyramis BW_CC]|nr:hypothetical protein AX15_005129 [Amanita polypyramis BW_CC]